MRAHPTILKGVDVATLGDPELEANYRALRSERGLSWADLAAQVGAGPNGQRLVAWMRAEDAESRPVTDRAVPRQRTRTRHEVT